LLISVLPSERDDVKSLSLIQEFDRGMVRVDGPEIALLPAMLVVVEGPATLALASAFVVVDKPAVEGGGPKVEGPVFVMVITLAESVPVPIAIV
jgi:hypothetical protein